MWLEITQKSKKHYLALSSDLALNENEGRSTVLYAVSRGRVKKTSSLKFIRNLFQNSICGRKIYKRNSNHRICLRGRDRRKLGR